MNSCHASLMIRVGNYWNQRYFIYKREGVFIIQITFKALFNKKIKKNKFQRTWTLKLLN